MITECALSKTSFIIAHASCEVVFEQKCAYKENWCLSTTIINIIWNYLFSIICKIFLSKGNVTDGPGTWTGKMLHVMASAAWHYYYYYYQQHHRHHHLEIHWHINILVLIISSSANYPKCPFNAYARLGLSREERFNATELNFNCWWLQFCFRLVSDLLITAADFF